MLLFTSLTTTHTHHDTLNLWPVLFCFLGGVLLPQTSAAKDYWKAGVKKHNEYRAAHGVPLLELDEKLAEMADMCAKYYTDTGRFDHSCPHKGPGSENAENVHKGYAKKKSDVESVEGAAKSWYDEIKDYDFNKNDAKDGKGFGNIGHFTQLTWKNSKRLGMGYSKSGDWCIVVGLYSPPGNYPGKYKENVFPPLSGAGDVPGQGQSQNSSASGSLIGGSGPTNRGTACLALSFFAMSVGSISGR